MRRSRRGVRRSRSGGRAAGCPAHASRRATAPSSCVHQAGSAARGEQLGGSRPGRAVDVAGTPQSSAAGAPRHHLQLWPRRQSEDVGNVLVVAVSSRARSAASAASSAGRGLASTKTQVARSGVCDGPLARRPVVGAGGPELVVGAPGLAELGPQQRSSQQQVVTTRGRLPAGTASARRGRDRRAPCRTIERPQRSVSAITASQSSARMR